MAFPREITSLCKAELTLGLRPRKLISDYSKPYQWWRYHTTPSAEAVVASDWIQDFWGDAFDDYSERVDPNIMGLELFDLSLLDWLRHRLILGPPRPRSHRELAEMNEDYLTMSEFHSHYKQWMKTWPDPDDHSWCSGPYRTTLPDWVISDYNKKP